MRQATPVLILALLPLLFAAIAIWLGSEYRRLGSIDEQAERAHSRQLVLSELFSAIKDAETGQRGYVVSGDDAFLEPYYMGQSAVSRHLARLRSIPTETAERDRIEVIARLADAKFAEMERVIAQRRSIGFAPAAASVSGGHGKRLMDQIRIEADEARGAEAAILARTLARQDARTAETERIASVVVGTTSLVFIVFLFFFWRTAHARAELERQAEQAAARHSAIFDGTLDAIVLINPSGSIETINRAASQLFGYAESELIRRDISAVVDLAPGDGPFLDRLGLGPDGLADPFRAGLFVQRSDGSAIPVEAALGLMPLPDGVHIVAAFRDISEREKSEQIKDQFLSTVSHELRTPLTSIVGSLGLMRGGVDGKLPAGAQRLVVIAENNANRLIRLVNDLLDIEKFESGAMSFEFEPLDLRGSAAKAVAAIRGFAQHREVRVEFTREPDPVMVCADGERLIQVINNLLANAIRFTPKDHRVTLSVMRRADHAEVSVTDEGPGIDDELRGRLFTRFAQSMQAPAGTTRGTGLGLAISREIVRSHGGGIWFEPRPTGGSRFAFSLPLWSSVIDEAQPDGVARLLICAADGEAEQIVAALDNRSIRADVVHDLAVVLPALREHRYAALLLDCLTGRPSDAQLIRDIRADSETRTLPIIAIADQETQDALASLEFVDWISRPFDAARLNHALAGVVERVAGAKPLILHVDDDTDTLEIISTALAGRARMARATDVASARAFIAKSRPDVVIVDLALPDGSGEEVIEDLARAEDPATPVVIYSAQERASAFANEVSAVLMKSARSTTALVSTIGDILEERGR